MHHHRFTYCLLALMTLIVSGCSTTKILEATGGSRSDGVVELSYTVHRFEIPDTDPEQGLSVARARCQAWGYRSAEAFGGSKKTCQNQDCSVYVLTFPYQCTQ